MPYSLGDHVAPFTLPRVNGGTFTVDPFSSAATVVVFTANHCPFALAWHPRLDAVARDYAARGVSVVHLGVNDNAIQPADSIEASAARVADGQFFGPYVHDETQDLARLFGAERTPDVYVIDGRGHLVYHGAPDADHEQETEHARYVRRALDDVLACRPVELSETAPVGCSIKWSAPAAEAVTLSSAST